MSPSRSTSSEKATSSPSRASSTSLVRIGGTPATPGMGASPLQMVAPARRFNCVCVACWNRTTGSGGRDDRGIRLKGVRPYDPGMDRSRHRRARIVLPAILLIAGLLAPAVAVAATDTDHDGLPNTWERTYSLTSPSRADTDRDGLPDGREDPDHDGLTNRQEYVAHMNPRRADTDRDGIRDGREDTDHDGLRTAFEFLAGTSPRRADSDGDGIRDGSESPDHDGLSNRAEQTLGTKPRVRDTDGDGWSDGAEHKAGTNPLKASSHPVTATPPVPPPPPPPPPPPGDGEPVTAPTLPAAPSCPVFPATNVWNVPIDGRPVASDSATLISAIGLDRGLHMDFGSYAGYGIPYQVVTSATARSTVAFDYDDESDHVGYPIPASPLIEGGADH